MSGTTTGTASGMVKDHTDFVATIPDADELPTIAFIPGSTAFNVENALNGVLAQLTAAEPEDAVKARICYEVTQMIRTILKDWREYKVKLGEEYMPGEVLDGWILGYSVMDKLGEDRQNHESLRYKVAHSFTAELKIHSQKKDFTQEKLEGIIAAAAKVYLRAIAAASSYEGSVQAIERDPQPSLAKFAGVVFDPPKAQGIKRKDRPSGGEEELEQGTETSQPKKKLRKLKPAPVIGTGQTVSSPTGGKDDRGSGNFGHGKPVKWSLEEHESAVAMLREDPTTTFALLTKMHNEKWEGTAYDDGKHTPVVRGPRTKEAVQARFKKIRQDLGGGKAAKKSSPTAAKANEEAAGEEDAVGEQDEDEEGGEIDADQEDDDEDEDPLTDLEELDRRIVEGEAFEDE